MSTTTGKGFFMEFSDRLNPVLIKETIQALKSRFFLISFVFMLSASLLLGIIGLMALDVGGARSATSYRGGEEAALPFLIIYYCLAFASLFLVPAFAFRSFGSSPKASLIRRPPLHSSTIRAAFRTPVGALRLHAFRRASTSDWSNGSAGRAPLPL